MKILIEDTNAIASSEVDSTNTAVLLTDANIEQFIECMVSHSDALYGIDDYIKLLTDNGFTCTLINSGWSALDEDYDVDYDVYEQEFLKK